MMLKSKAPCYHCEDRVAGCHSLCARYNDWKKNRAEFLKKQHAETEVSSAIYALKDEAIRKRMKGRNGR